MTDQAVIYLSYRDADGQKGYSVEKLNQGAWLVRPGVLPGAFGYPALHAFHIQVQINLHVGPRVEIQPLTLYVVAITDHPPTEDEKRQIVHDGFKYLAEQGLVAVSADDLVRAARGARLN